MNAILSIKPHFVEEIKAGRKRFEFRKTVFKQQVEKVYVYASAPVSMIIGEFQPVDVVMGTPAEVWKQTERYSGITKEFFDEYFKGRRVAYAIVIQNFVEYETPRRIPFQAPQSYRYVDFLFQNLADSGKSCNFATHNF